MITKKHVGVKTDIKKLSKSKDVEQNVKKREERKHKIIFVTLLKLEKIPLILKYQQKYLKNLYYSRFFLRGFFSQVCFQK